MVQGGGNTNTGDITKKPLMLNALGKVQRLDDTGVIQIGTVTAINDLFLTSGSQKSIIADVNTGTFQIKGGSNGEYNQLNSSSAMHLINSTTSNASWPHHNPPAIIGVGQYYISGSSTERSLGKLGMAATAVNESGEISAYSLIWADNSNASRWKVDNNGVVNQDGDLNFNSSYTGRLNSVREINGVLESQLSIGYSSDITRIKITADDTSILNNTKTSYVKVATDGNIYNKTDSTHSIVVSNANTTLNTYGSLLMNWLAPTQLTEFPAMSLSLSSNEGVGPKAPKLSILNEMVYNTSSYTTTGGDISLQTNIKATTSLNSITSLGGNIILQTTIDKTNLPLANAGKIILQSGNSGKGITDYGMLIQSDGSIKCQLSPDNTSSISTSSIFHIKKNVSLTSSGIKMMSLQGTGGNDYAEVILVSNLNSSTPGATGSIALDINGAIWVKKSTNWVKLATLSDISSSNNSVIVNIPFNAGVATNTIVAYNGTSGGSIYVSTISANVHITNVIGVATSTTNYVQIQGIASILVASGESIAAGTALYLSMVTAGAVSATKPTEQGNTVCPIGLAVSDSANGYCNVLLNIETPTYIPLS